MTADPSRTGSYLEQTTAQTPDATGGSPPTADLLAGRYRLGEPLGEGGMGSVYRAEQVHPVRRPVAVKLIRAGTDTARVVARFEGERQALAVMDHPNIAKVLDAGTTPDGRPFFAMELVEGAPLTAYCDAHRLTVPDRLRLFAQVCQAVQHAHQKGVIHRDLKPGNILVAEADGKPVPKVIDFGLAKALDAGVLPDVSVDGSVLGTPLYMAPEQADAAADVDTRADVYALGVILYELLTGSTPLTRESFRKAAFGEMMRMVREVDPPTPVRRLDSTDAVAGIAAVRGIEPGRLKKLVRGDLEWVTMKCLEKDRGRRYETANALAAEVQRYLADEPVAAGPPGRWYRARKFVRRNRGPVVAGGLVAAALVAGMVGTSLGYLEARGQERTAREETGRKETALQAAAASEAAAQERLTQLTGFSRVLADSYKDLRPDAEKKSGVALRVQIGRRLEAMAKGLDERAIGDPRTTARLQVSLAAALHSLGFPVPAVELMAAAHALNLRDLGPAHPDTLDAAQYWVTFKANTPDGLAAAARDGERMLAEAEAVVGPGHRSTWELRNSLGDVYFQRGEGAKGLAVHLALKTEKEAALAPDDPYAVGASFALAVAYYRANDVEKALALTEQLLDRPAPPVADDVPTRSRLQLWAMLVGVYFRQEKWDRATAAAQQYYDGLRELDGDDHINTVKAKQFLSSVHVKAGRLKQGIGLATEAMAAKARILGADHHETLGDGGNLVRMHLRQGGDRAEGLRLAREVVARSKAKYGLDSPEVFDNLHLTARRLMMEGEPGLGEEIARGIIEACDAKQTWPLPEARPNMLLIRATCLSGLNRPKEAEPVLADVEANLGRLKPTSNALSMRLITAGVYTDMGKHAEALRNLTTVHKEVTRPGHPTSRESQAVRLQAIDELIRNAEARKDAPAAQKWKAERNARSPASGPPGPSK